MVIFIACFICTCYLQLVYSTRCNSTRLYVFFGYFCDALLSFSVYGILIEYIFYAYLACVEKIL